MHCKNIRIIINKVGPGFIIPSIYGYKRYHVYGAGSFTKMETRHKISVDMRIFFTLEGVLGYPLSFLPSYGLARKYELSDHTGAERDDIEEVAMNARDRETST